MVEILKIINDNLGPKHFNKKSFTGNVFFQDNNGLKIERSVYNRLLNKFNTAFNLEDGDLLTNDDDLLLVFINEIFEDNSSSLFRMDRNYYLSTVLIDWGLLSIWSEETEGSNKEPDIVFAQPWEDIDFVELFEAESGGYLFRFYEKGKTEQFDLLSNRFGTYSLEASKKLLSIFNEIIEFKKQTNIHSISEHSELKSKIENLIKELNYNEALTELNNFSNTYNVEDITIDDSSFFYLNKTISLINLKQFSSALEIIESYIKKCEDNDHVVPLSYELQGEILLNQNKQLPAINCFAYSEEMYEDENFKKEVRLLKEESYSKLKDEFLDIPYNERKLIFVGEDIYATKSREIVTLRKNDMPSSINFPIGHPHINNVYTCHPHKQNFYLPLKNYSEELFLDRINEFSYLLQCLGATELNISSSKSSLTDQSTKSKKEIDANIDLKVNNVKTNIKGEIAKNNSVDIELKIAKNQSFKPIKAPYIPSNLVWYQSDLNWQRLVDQRLNGSIMTHSEVMSSSQSENISAHELKQIDSELKLLFTKIGVKYNSEDEIATSSTKKHEWVVKVNFEDIGNLNQLEESLEKKLLNNYNTENNQTNVNFEKYKEDILFMIEDDGIIDDAERKILDRKIKKYGITEEEAISLENEVICSNYSENELLYIEELKDIIEDEVITEIELKMLDRYAKKFKVDNETKEKINSIFIK